MSSSEQSRMPLSEPKRTGQHLGTAIQNKGEMEIDIEHLVQPQPSQCLTNRKEWNLLFKTCSYYDVNLLRPVTNCSVAYNWKIF